ncbi:MAG TPA: GspH/FimT family pseudopilin [Arenicellales bacterium]|nr:GspH/FimT family pseudopilin [Arenicellales bacterium]
MQASRDGGRPDGPGFSMVELMVTLAIAGILLASAGPSFVDLVRDKRITAEINLLLADVHLARMAAIKRNLDVVLCRSSDARHCDQGGGQVADWSKGRIIYIDLDGDKQRGNSEPLLQARGALPHGLRLRFNQWWRVIYHPDGGARNGTFSLCGPRGPEHARTLILFYTGRPRIDDKRADGKEVACG